MNLQEALTDYCLEIGDTALIHGQRLSEWCGHAPILEEDIALSNIALDLIGQARIMLTYAGRPQGLDRDENHLAFFRDAHQFRNVLMAELPNGDFGFTTGKIFFLSLYMKHLYSLLSHSSDTTLSAFAARSLKEVIYHARHSSDWVIRLGDGTDESHQRMQQAVDELALFIDDLFENTPAEQTLIHEQIIPDLGSLRERWQTEVNKVLQEATLSLPQVNNFLRKGGKRGLHTEHLGHLLAEMQFLPRAYPDAKW
jgi:ring-1,2-phenylacetyl-CoA epoxidase subunit PaaC